MKNSSASTEKNWQTFLLLSGLGLLLLRILTVVFTTLNLGPDEAQYWRWSTSFDWGYYSKPPMIAWVIGVETSLFGDAEWAIRIGSPLFHVFTGAMLYLLGKHIWSVRAGVLAALIYLLMPAVWLSSIIMSTDVQLMAFWALSLFLLFLFRDAPSWKLGLALGISIGFGFLSKYAMIYFLVGIGLSLLFDKPLRAAFLSRSGLSAIAGLVLTLLPHIAWSIRTGFKTVSHTADNANWDQELLNPENGLKFLGDQFGVFGPLSFALLLAFFVALVIGATQLRRDSKVRILLTFILPPLTIILLQAFISRAHANWAASAYPAAAVLMAVWACHATKYVRPVLYAGFAINLIAGLIFTFTVVAPAEIANDLGLANAMKRLRGWPETTERVKQLAIEMNASAIILDEREVWHGLDYYGRDGALDFPLRAWRRSSHAESFSEEAPISQADAANAIVLLYRQDDFDKISADFETFESAGEIRQPLGGSKFRVLSIYRASGFQPVERASPAVE